MSSSSSTATDVITGHDAPAILRRHAEAVEHYLGKLSGRCRQSPPRLIEAMMYSLSAGGKRLRPGLILECFQACQSSSPQQSTRYKSALACAGAMELIHTFSLIHDDLPAMDDDDLRRGRPTNHKVYGEAMAILAGDAMVALAFDLLVSDADPAVAPILVMELARATGPEGMIGGQVLDIDGEEQNLSLAGLQQIHRMKTGALLVASCRLGALAAGASTDQLSAVTEYGRHLGLAFQIIDDVLDVTSTPEQLGKATNKDAAKGKNTYPSLLGLEASKAEAARQLEMALKSLSGFGSTADGLRALARFVVERNA